MVKLLFTHRPSTPSRSLGSLFTAAFCSGVITCSGHNSSASSSNFRKIDARSSGGYGVVCVIMLNSMNNDWSSQRDDPASLSVAWLLPIHLADRLSSLREMVPRQTSTHYWHPEW